MKFPKYRKTENQIKAGYNASGTQRCKCKERGVRYKINPKQRAYPKKIREAAIKMYYGGISARGVGKILKMNHANVINWIKKALQIELGNKCMETAQPAKVMELDELYWFLKRKPCAKTRENIYIITIVGRKPRQIMGYRVSMDKSSQMIQKVVNAAPEAENYCADLRHYIPTLARRSRCFPRKLENLRTFVTVFVSAYNRFGIQKERYRSKHPCGFVPFSLYGFFNNAIGHS